MTPPPPPHLRNEILSLGDRHQGDALGGARRELQDAQLSTPRRKLLQAVVRHLDPQSVGSHSPPVASAGPAVAGGWRNVAGAALYAGAFIVVAVWAVSALLRFAG
jgi:hypothetical protein